MAGIDLADTGRRGVLEGGLRALLVVPRAANGAVALSVLLNHGSSWGCGYSAVAWRCCTIAGVRSEVVLIGGPLTRVCRVVAGSRCVNARAVRLLTVLEHSTPHPDLLKPRA